MSLWQRPMKNAKRDKNWKIYQESESWKPATEATSWPHWNMIAVIGNLSVCFDTLHNIYRDSKLQGFNWSYKISITKWKRRYLDYIGREHIVSLDGDDAGRMWGWWSCRTFGSCGTAQRSEEETIFNNSESSTLSPSYPLIDDTLALDILKIGLWF